MRLMGVPSAYTLTVHVHAQAKGAKQHALQGRYFSFQAQHPDELDMFLYLST